ncbi:unknown [Collinsella sp. CAG:398]|nr:unknown [Collinsella sp. CAG:398]
MKWEQGARDGEPVGVSGVACSRLPGSARICHASFRAIHILRAAKEWLTYNGSIISHI